MNSLPEVIDKFKIPLGLSVVGFILIITGLITYNFKTSSQPEIPKESIVSLEKSISVDVSGAVVSPGVYQLKSDARVQDVLNKAGGITEEANKEYISKYLNLAQKISDGMKIYIPTAEETAPATGGVVGVVAGANSTQININSASQSELESLPGIGPVTAAKIIGGRPFAKIEDLLTSKVVSKATFEKIKTLVTIY